MQNDFTSKVMLIEQTYRRTYKPYSFMNFWAKSNDISWSFESTSTSLNSLSICSWKHGQAPELVSARQMCLIESRISFGIWIEGDWLLLDEKRPKEAFKTVSRTAVMGSKSLYTSTSRSSMLISLLYPSWKNMNRCFSEPSCFKKVLCFLSWFYYSFICDICA